MSHPKLEPRLAQFIENEKVRATAAGRVAAQVDDLPILVTISHHEQLRATSAADRTEQFGALNARVQESQKPILDRLTALGVKTPKLHTLVNAMTAAMTPIQMNQIAELDEVELIRLEAMDTVTCMNESVRVIEAVEARQDFHADGRGIKVAILDSGVDKSHPALTGKVVDEVSTVVGEGVNVPGNHGTHVAGTVASNDVIFRGVAPQCDIVNIKVLTSAGGGQPSFVIDGLEQAVRRGALVVNLSLGWSEVAHGWVCNDADCILCQAVDNAVRLGVTVVVAAGNEGNAGAKPPFAIRHPGAARLAITVGAVNKSKELSNFSSIGPGSGRLSAGSAIRLTKPDLAAPGEAITSSVLGGGFQAFNGTSMATPHVAGLVALLLQARPTFTPLMVKKLLEDTSEPITFAPNQAGYGVINVYGALLRAAGVSATLTAGQTT